MKTAPRNRAWLAREVVQSSAMDCGPAALKSLLDGFGIGVSYPRLQEACHTDLDGTSINTIERVALSFGLSAEQIMLPADCILLAAAQALPAVVVVRREQTTHFLIAWRRVGPLLQLMDPATGRRWTTPAAFRRELYIHRHRVPAQAWRSWAGSEQHCQSLDERLAGLGAERDDRERIIATAAGDPSWRSLALLDASLRMAKDFSEGGGVRPGGESVRLVDTIARRAQRSTNPLELVPAPYWSVWAETADEAQSVLALHGAVLLRVRQDAPVDPARDQTRTAAIAPDVLVDRLRESRPHPLREAWQLVRDATTRPMLILAAALLVAALGAVVELLLLRGLIESHTVLSLREHRLVALAVLLGFVGFLLAIDVAVSRGLLRLGRRIETGLRAAVAAKLPRTSEQFMSSRLSSDLAHRAHCLDSLHGLPDLGARAIRSSTQLLATAAGLAWLNPAAAWLAVLAAGSAIAIPLLMARIFAERELRLRVHTASLAGHYLDGLTGLVTARTHGAEAALRRQHESLLVHWGRAGVHLLRGVVAVEGIQLFIGSAFAAAIVIDFITRGARPGGALLVVYWALSLPMLGRDLAASIRQFPGLRNVVSRVLELLHAPEEACPTVAQGAAVAVQPIACSRRNQLGVSIELDNVDLRLSGRPVLNAVTLSIRPGEHVAIVGRSGAGKSSLMGLLLGTRSATSGRVVLDGSPLDVTNLAQVRQATAWVDPSVHLWNRSLLDNLRYGDASRAIANIGSIVQDAELTSIIESLPGGLQEPLGEGGGLTSGGEGQRVRFGRALFRDGVRLALMDEPFRGLDRSRRRGLLERARTTWADATLLCATHDIADTLAFERVIVVEGGRVVEDGSPEQLAGTPGSLYASLLAADRAAGAQWRVGWKRWQVERGMVTDQSAGGQYRLVSTKADGTYSNSFVASSAAQRRI